MRLYTIFKDKEQVDQFNTDESGLAAIFAYRDAMGLADRLAITVDIARDDADTFTAADVLKSLDANV